jgi:hypothetical protein
LELKVAPQFGVRKGRDTGTISQTPASERRRSPCPAVFGIALLKVKLAMLLLQLHCYQGVELLRAFMVGMF